MHDEMCSSKKEMQTDGRQLTFLEEWWMVSRGKQPRAMDCLSREKAALIMVWEATQAAAVATANTIQ